MALHLCKICVEEYGLDNSISTLPQFFGNFLKGMLGSEIDTKHPGRSLKKCHKCGSTWDEFQKTGLLGCNFCYQSFYDEINLVLKRIHGSNKHIGSRPKSHRHFLSVTEMEHAKAELQKAVESQNFERAAELRDMIRDAQRLREKTDRDGILR
ncbi:MAG: UvrB/UvrC motif-containing protein [bacterium]